MTITASQWAARVALATALVLFWMIGAVGALGPDDEHPADVMYIVVLAVGIGGAIVARFQASGMARALCATAAAQMAVPVIALLAGMHPARGTANLTAILGTLILNGLFAGLFIGAALLFAKGGREQAPPPPRRPPLMFEPRAFN